MIEELKNELEKLYNQGHDYIRNKNNILNRIIEIWDQLAGERDLPEIKGRHARDLIHALMVHQDLTGFTKALDRNILSQAIIADGNPSLIFTAIEHTDEPTFFRMIFEKTDKLSLFGGNKDIQQQLINSTFCSACYLACFETMKLLVDDADINCKGLLGQSLLFEVIKSNKTDHQIYEVLKFLYENGTDLTQFNGTCYYTQRYSLFSPRPQTPFEMLLETRNIEAMKLFIDMGIVDIFKDGPQYLELAEQQLQHALKNDEQGKQKDFQQIINMLSSYGMLRHETPAPH